MIHTKHHISKVKWAVSCPAQMRTICPTTSGKAVSLSTRSARRDIDILAYVPPTWPFAMRPGFTQTVDPTSCSQSRQHTSIMLRWEMYDECWRADKRSGKGKQRVREGRLDFQRPTKKQSSKQNFIINEYAKLWLTEFHLLKVYQGVDLISEARPLK